MTLCKLSDLVEGEGKLVKFPGRNVAVFLRNETVHVFDDRCPHAGASLSGGTLDEDSIVCPWHQWAFSLEDGAVTGGGRCRISIYPNRVENGEVLADIPTPTTIDADTIQA
jgi:nitrite reductase (NADH) small subunit/3-phenylpropionate/trans-cinnamate dioxygenase ferredoxin subunit